MKKYFFTLLFFNSIFLCAQEKKATSAQIGQITGKVIDAISKEPIPYVTIICRNNRKKTLSGGITNKKGIFSVKELPLDSLQVTFQFIGYQTIQKLVVLSSKQKKIDLQTILLTEIPTDLDEIVIESETSSMVQKIDRKVIHVGKDLANAGTNAIQMLDNIPSISVDYTSGAISFRGNKNVRILIDGKPSNLRTDDLLKQISSTTVKSVELITNPSAKYSPEGMSGIVNIILKKNTKIGFNGSVTIGVEHSRNTRPTSSVSLNYKKGKVSFFSNYSYDTGDYETFNGFSRTDKVLEQTFDFLDRSDTHFLRAGMDIYLNDKNTLSFYTTQSFTSTDFYTKTKVFDTQNTLLNASNLAIFDIKERAYNLDYKIDFDKKAHNLEFEINYTTTKNPEKDFNKEFTTPPTDEAYKLYNFENNITDNVDTYLLNIDYTNPLSEKANLELGAEARVQKAAHRILTDQEVLTTGNPSVIPVGNTNFSYNRFIYSAYINYSHTFKKVSLQTGVRFEQFKVDGLFNNTQLTNAIPITDTFFNAYPSLYLTYSATDNDEFQIAYSRRVDRPSIYQVTPIQEWNSPLTLSVGNRDLQPQFTNSFELNYTHNFNKGYLTFGAFYRSTKDKIGRILYQDDINPDKQIISYTNYNNADSYGVELSASYKPVKWWTIRPSAELYKQESNGIINNQLETVNNTLFRSRIRNSFKISKRFRLQASASYRGQSRNVQFIIDPYVMFNASARWTILEGKGTLSIRGTDIFNNVNLKFSSTNPFPQNGYYVLEYNAIYIGFTYNFGSGKNKERNRKYRDENETQASGGIL